MHSRSNTSTAAPALSSGIGVKSKLVAFTELDCRLHVDRRSDRPDIQPLDDCWSSLSRYSGPCRLAMSCQLLCVLLPNSERCNIRFTEITEVSLNSAPEHSLSFKEHHTGDCYTLEYRTIHSNGLDRDKEVQRFHALLRRYWLDCIVHANASIVDKKPIIKESITELTETYYSLLVTSLQDAIRDYDTDQVNIILNEFADEVILDLNLKDLTFISQEFVLLCLKLLHTVLYSPAKLFLADSARQTLVSGSKVIHSVFSMFINLFFRSTNIKSNASLITGYR